ncbi:MAG: DUF2069 domain-containing protein [Halopseudomonas yangmingensis]|uniref:Uncharacterized membrane protein n=1 Tax=Halopseudomonas yangmingensis TaxID=1720063 RepID=A0A1I4NGF2_9GAMM|nr:DUF2069 domain-containing protein [Halopseudomonas yangmingensis]SFM14387.1 Uncharacterized membrane protein [Halopseudomonas yangmingensis]
MSRTDRPLPARAWLLPRLRISRLLSTLGYVGLLVSLAGWNLLFADLHGANPLVITGVLLVPLLIFLPGIISGHARTQAWLCFAINLYFIHGVLACFHPQQLLYGLLVSGFSLLYFIAALGYVRWSFQLQRLDAGEPAATSQAPA